MNMDGEEYGANRSQEEKKRIFTQIDRHLAKDQRPSDYLEELSHTAMFRQTPFSMLFNLKETEQSPLHHPEGNVWNHTMLVVDEAAKVRNKSRDERVFMWAALLHDIGKPQTTRIRKGKVTAYGHDRVGAELAKEFLDFFLSQDEFTEKVTALVRWHMQLLYVLKDLPFSEISEMKSQTDIREVALLGFCDRTGRKNADYRKEAENMKEFLYRLNVKEVTGNERKER